MPKFYRLLLSLVTLLYCAFPLSAKIRLPYFFSDNMILQRSFKPAIWGWTDTKNQVTITTSWDKKKYVTKPDEKGKWKINIVTPKAGGPYSMIISDGTPVTINNILMGDVWLCSGQSNMEMPMKGFKDQPIANSNDLIFESDNDNIRLYNIPRSVKTMAQDTSKYFSWKIANPQDVANFSATGYMFGKFLYDKLKVPIGLINISYGGTPVESFMDEASLKNYPTLKIPDANETKLTNKLPTVIYNGMLHPFIGYGIKGAIWYQGETNTDRPKQYELLFPEFVQMLRNQFAIGEFPFYYVQISPYDYNQYNKPGDKVINSAYLRDAQRKSTDKIPNSGMVVTMDISNEKYIHHWDKQTVGKRLALLALNKTYGYKGFQAESPLYESLNFRNDTAIITFKNAANGLTSYGKTLSNFEIADNDKKFYPAHARIVGGKVEISSPNVTKPVAVRYAFKNYVMGDLFNTEGFPASSFRTDDWDEETIK